MPEDNPCFKLVENAVWLAHVPDLEYEDSAEYANIIYELAKWFEGQEYELWSGEDRNQGGVVMDYYTAIDMVGMTGLYQAFGDGSDQMRAHLEAGYERMMEIWPQNTFPTRDIEMLVDETIANLRGISITEL